MARALTAGSVRKAAAKAPRARGRARLSEAFLAALADDYEAHGAAAIAALRIEKPSDYVKLEAALLPKDTESAAEGRDNGAKPVAIEVRFVRPEG